MKKEYYWWAFTCLIIIWSFMRLYSYAATITAPFGWDQSAHLIISKIVDSYFDQGNYIDGLRYYRFYPLLSHISYIPFINLMGISRVSVTLYMFTWILVLFIGVRLVSSKILPVLHQILLLLCCLLLFSTRGIYVWEPMLEIPLTISIILFYLLIYRLIILNKYSMLLTLAVAIITTTVLQVKGSGIPYLIIPLFLYWCGLFKNVKRTVIWHLILFGGVLFLINDWYWFNLDQHLDDVWFINVFTGLEVKQDPQSWRGAMMYLTMIVQNLGMLMIVPIALLANFLLGIKRFKPTLNTSMMLVISQVLTFILLVISPNKDYRYVFTWIVLSIVIMIIISARIASNKLIARLIIGVSLLLFYRIDFELTPTDRRTFAYNELPRLAKKHDVSHLNYFFEDDSPWYNYANLELLHLTTLPLPYTLLNRNSIDTFIERSGDCDISAESTLIFVYNNKIYQKNKPTYHVPFTDYCQNINVLSACEIVEVLEPNVDERLTIYHCELI